MDKEAYICNLFSKSCKKKKECGGEKGEKTNEVKYWQLKNWQEGHTWTLCTTLANFLKV